MFDVLLRAVEEWLPYIFAILSCVLTFVRTGSIKKMLNKDNIEMNKIKYNTISTVKSVPQSFTEYVDNYILNPETNVLEKLDTPINVQDKINSFIDSCFQRSLERFMPQNVVEEDVVSDYTQRTQDLAGLAEAMEIAEDYRDKYHLPDTYSMSDIYSFVNKQASELKAKLNNPNVNNDTKTDKKEEE